MKTDVDFRCPQPGQISPPKARTGGGRRSLSTTHHVPGLWLRLAPLTATTRRMPTHPRQPARERPAQRERRRNRSRRGLLMPPDGPCQSTQALRPMAGRRIPSPAQRSPPRPAAGIALRRTPRATTSTTCARSPPTRRPRPTRALTRRVGRGHRSSIRRTRRERHQVLSLIRSYTDLFTVPSPHQRSWVNARDSRVNARRLEYRPTWTSDVPGWAVSVHTGATTDENRQTPRPTRQRHSPRPAAGIASLPTGARRPSAADRPPTRNLGLQQRGHQMQSRVGTVDLRCLQVGLIGPPGATTGGSPRSRSPA